MFYTLATIDAAPAPVLLTIDGTQYLVARAGLLLEPPPAPRESAGREGYALMQFFGPVQGREGFIASSAEPYRCRGATIDISRRESDRGARFTGTIDGGHVQLRALGGSSLLPPGTVLEFVAAPDEPITDDWSDTFNFGPPHVPAIGRSGADDPQASEAIRQWIASREPERLRAAQVRLERAWWAASTADTD